MLTGRPPRHARRAFFDSPGIPVALAVNRASLVASIMDARLIVPDWTKNRQRAIVRLN